MFSTSSLLPRAEFTSFTVFPAANRSPGTIYESAAVQVPTASKARIWLTVLDLIAEPVTTIVHWTIQRSPAEAGPWVHMISSHMTGFDGEPQPRPVGELSCSVGTLNGQWIRGWMWFETAGDTRLRLGVDGEIA